MGKKSRLKKFRRDLSARSERYQWVDETGTQCTVPPPLSFLRDQITGEVLMVMSADPMSPAEITAAIKRLSIFSGKPAGTGRAGECEALEVNSELH